MLRKKTAAKKVKAADTIIAAPEAPTLKRRKKTPAIAVPTPISFAPPPPPPPSIETRGRKKLPADQRKVTLGVGMRQGLVDNLRDIAKTNETSIGAIVCKVVEQYVSRANNRAARG